MKLSYATIPTKDPTQQQFTTPNIFNKLNSNGIAYIKLTNVLLSGLMLIWTIFLVAANYESFVHMFNEPTVKSIMYFSFCIFVLLSIAAIMTISVLIQFAPSAIRTSIETIKIIIATICFVMAIGFAFVLAWSIRSFSLRLNVSLLLTFFYPIAESGLCLYLLHNMSHEGITVRLTLP